MMCPKCGKLIDDAVVRCPDCGAEFDLQYAAPRVEPGPTKLQQTQPAVIPKSVPAGTVRRAPAGGSVSSCSARSCSASSCSRSPCG
ncbi:MAG: hypothetical protein ACLRH1_02180 [Acutalibacteraceae bacterium]